MKKYFKLLAIITIPFLLSGCDDAWDKVKDLNNFTCTYVSEDSNGIKLKSDNAVLKKIILSKDDTAVKAKYVYKDNSSNLKTLVSADKYNDKNTIHDTVINYDSTDASDFATDYRKNNKCNSNIFLKNTGNNTYDFKNSCSGKKCKKFKLDNNNSTELVSPYQGTCICLNMNTQEFFETECSEHYKGLSYDLMIDDKTYLEAVGGGVCSSMCQEIVSYSYWYNDDRCLSCTSKTPKVGNHTYTKAEAKKDCTYTGINTHDNSDKSDNCSNSMKKSECESNEEYTWNDSTNCCEKPPKCYLVAPDGDFAYANLYWREDCPCDSDEELLKNPNCKCKVRRDIEKENCVTLDKGTVSQYDVDNANYGIIKEYKLDPISIKTEKLSCEELLGENLQKIVHFSLTFFRIAGSIIAIVNGMIILIPAVAKKDEDMLKNSEKKLIILGIVLLLMILLPVFINAIGIIGDYDLSCI